MLIPWKVIFKHIKAEKTLIEGAVYFDIEKDKLKRETIKQERNKLVQLMLLAKEGGEKTRTPVKKDKIKMTCETIN